jgi:hypothetical protein
VTCTFHKSSGANSAPKGWCRRFRIFDFTTSSRVPWASTIWRTGRPRRPARSRRGNYFVTESAVDGWDVTGVTCDDGRRLRPSTGSSSQRTVSFAIEAGESVTCTFTNTKRGTLTVTKVTALVSDRRSCVHTLGTDCRVLA